MINWIMNELINFMAAGAMGMIQFFCRHRDMRNGLCVNCFKKVAQGRSPKNCTNVGHDLNYPCACKR